MKNDGGPAFPTKKWTEIVRDESGQIEACVKSKNHPGMSLRDWFAGMALGGWYTNTGHLPAEGYSTKYAEHFYQMADAMLAEREKDSSKST